MHLKYQTCLATLASLIGLWARPSWSEETAALPIKDAQTCVFGRKCSEKAPESFPYPQLAVTLASNRVPVGGVIWATVELTNPKGGYLWKLNAPYSGAFVATVGIWRSRWDPFSDSNWGELREIISLNYAYAKDLCEGKVDGSRYYSGPFLLLKPGQSIKTTMPLNVMQRVVNPEVGRESLWWLPGVGFTEPGKYQIRLQYANLGSVFPYAKTCDLSELPLRAIVSEPVELEIYMPKTRDRDRLMKLIHQFEWSGRTRDDTMPDPRVTEVAAVLDGLDSKETEVRDSLLLLTLRAKINEAESIKGSERISELTKTLQECDNKYIILSKAADPLAEPYGITECCLLRALGRDEDAKAFAQKLKSPDAAAFLAAYNERK